MKKTAFYLFATTFIFAPMAFGTVETWSYLVLELLVCASAVLLYLSSAKKNFYRVPGLFPLILVLTFLCFQIIPLPGSVVKFLSPSTYAIYEGVTGLFGGIGWISFSIYPHATLVELLRFSTYLLFYIVAIQFFADKQLLKKTITIIAGFAALLSLITIIEFFTEHLHYPFAHNKIFWFRELSQGGTPAGPYVNRNHYAGLMEMIFPLILSMFLVYRPQISRVSLKRRIADFFNQKRVNLHFLYGVAAILIATSILLSLSRGGILSLSVSMVIFSAMLIVKAKQKKTGLLIGFIIIIVLLLTGTSGWDAIFKRFENLRNQTGLIYDSRLIIWKDSINIIREFPIVGTGAGTFEKIYPLYRSFPGNDILEHAHNDYLEFLCTGGIILTALMGWCLVSILYPAVKSFLRRREWYSVLLFTGCLTSISAICLHSLVDFNMQVGANGLYFFLVLALAVSAANTRMRNGLGATYLKQSEKLTHLTGIAAFFLILAVGYTHGGALIANRYFSNYRNISLTPALSEKQLFKINRAAKTAAAFDMLNSEYPHAVARVTAMMPKNSEALKNYSKSIRLAPLNSSYLMDAAFFIHQQGNQNLAESLYQRSIACNKNNMAAYIEYAAMLFEINQPEKSFRIMKQAISVDTDVTDTCLALMAQNHIADNRMYLALPDRVEPYLVLGDFFDSLGDMEKAKKTYTNALKFLPNEKQVEKHYFTHVYQFYRRNDQYENALHVILKAIIYFPEDHGLHRIAGGLYKKIGIDYRADEEYRKANILKSK